MVSLLFEAEERPRSRAIIDLAAQAGQFSVSLDPRDGADLGAADLRWVEVLANGLTFDVVGLLPGEPAVFGDPAHKYGLAADFDPAKLQAVAILPGPHLTSGGTMVPVVRCLAWLAAQLSLLEGVKAVVWHPARTCCEPGYYRDAVIRWIEGGAFPGLGLASLVPQADGSLLSEGLALFTGQELGLAPELAGDRPAAARIALRLLHWLVENGRLDQLTTLPGLSGETLVLEPNRKTGIVRVCKGSE